MNAIRILFLGASRPVGLMERFQSAAEHEGVHSELFSVEDNAPWHPIAVAGICHAVPGPRFAEAAFAPFLLDLVRRKQIHAVVPNIDAAALALSAAKPALEEVGARAIVSDARLCAAMNDKQVAESFFRENRVPVPSGESWPRIAKPRIGASSRGQVIFRDVAEFEFWAARNRHTDHVVQPYLQGTEYSVDAYISGEGRCLGAVSRVRVVVSGGEVMVARTEHNARVLAIADQVLATPGWRGPVNIQIMDTTAGAFLLEVNPRFSSGHTLAIEAGLDSPRWIIRETLGRPLPERAVEWRSGLCMTRSRKDHFLWLS